MVGTNLYLRFRFFRTRIQIHMNWSQLRVT